MLLSLVEDTLWTTISDANAERSKARCQATCPSSNDLRLFGLGGMGFRSASRQWLSQSDVVPDAPGRTDIGDPFLLIADKIRQDMFSK
jgi:hypothetical protein